ncbi:multidrug effflux MFS transporter [Cognatishimia sp. MH4019]|uniref:multidrug effflux MFS transporter n=1 Tax=Cognatishimia sp. MH4019 TaxID=2854030 RepID=UPI001CD687D0|nr:multidrug effflux MFS transporter [Cognatishimia sp. MH4019]
MTTLPASRYLDRFSPPHITTLVLSTAVGSVTINIFLPSMPEMATFFGKPYAVIQLTLTVYLALTGVAILVLGPLSDLYGRRPVMLWSFALFIAASIGAAFAQSFAVFMLFRALQAAVVSSFVVGRAVVRDQVAREKAASLLGYVTMGQALAPMIAPAIGGALGDAFGWQASFHALTVFGIVALALIYFDQGETFHGSGAGMRAQMRNYPDLFRSRRFWGYTLLSTFASGTFFAYLGGAPYVGVNVYGLSAGAVGLYMAFTPTGYVIGNFISGRFAMRIGIFRMLLLGALITLSFMSMTLVAWGLGVTHPLGFFFFTFSIGLGNGIILPSASAGLLDVRPDLAGSASGLSGSIMTFGGAALSTLSGLLLTAYSGVLPLILCILGASLLCLSCALYTISVEKRLRAP